MRKRLTFILLFAVLIAYAQQHIQFSNGTYKEILERAKKENKIVFVDAYASWCGPCKLMEKNVFTDQSVADYYNANFINLRLDMEKGEGPAVARQFQVGSYPSYLFLNGDGELVFRGMGYLNSNDFIALAKQANNPFTKKGSLKVQFEQGERDPEFLKNVIKMYANSDTDLAKRASERYFSNKKDKAFTQEEVSMLLYFLRSTKDPNFRVFAESRDEITKVLPINIYNQFDAQLKLADVAERATNNKDKTIDSELYLQEASKLLPPTEARESLAKYKMNYYATQDNFAKYEEAALEYFGDGENHNAQELGAVAFVFAEKTTSPESLKKALVWSEKAVMGNETFENTYVLAKLYLKNGNTKAAKMYADQSLALAKKAGADTAPIVQLIAEIK